MQNMNAILHQILTILFTFVSASSGLDTYDFLNENYLPSTLVLESSLLDEGINTTNKDCLSGDLDNALSTMTFHSIVNLHYSKIVRSFNDSKRSDEDDFFIIERSSDFGIMEMINEYLCRNFIAKEIVEEFEIQGHIASDRLGMAAENKSGDYVKNDQKSINGLLDDVGSESYKKWLARSAILNDIYKHYDQHTEEDTSRQHELFASGEVTGYAVEADNGKSTTVRHTIGGTATNVHQHHPELDTLHGGGYGGHNFEGHTVSEHTHQPPSHGLYGFGSTHTPDFGYSGDEHYYHPSHHNHYGNGHEKGLALKDLFDLALTALAFLAFGMFILNIIMTCFAAQQGTTLVMQLNDTDGTLIGRTKHGIGQEEMDRRSIDRLSYHILNSIDSLTELYKKDEGQSLTEKEHCFRLSICECNKFSRYLPSRQQIWVPVWSFGISWISGKMTDYSSMLENLKATILGLGKAECNKTYPSCKGK